MENKEKLLVPEGAKLITPPASLTFHAEQDGKVIEIIKLTKGTNCCASGSGGISKNFLIPSIQTVGDIG